MHALTLDELLNKWIPYKLEAIETLSWAWSISEAMTDSRIQIVVGGECKLNGNIYAITNPMIEAGFIHARSLLEFLGFAATKDGRLTVVPTRRRSDIAIENFSTGGVILNKVSLESLASQYDGPREEIEESLTALLQTANLLLAHITDGRLSKEWNSMHIDLALRCIPILLFKHLYEPLGRNLPQLSANFTLPD